MPKSVKVADEAPVEEVSTVEDNAVDTVALYTQLCEEFEKTYTRSIGSTNLTYITGEQVITRLNEVLGLGNWSWVTEKPEIVEDEVLVKGILSIILDGNVYQTADYTGFGGSRIKRNRDGRALSIGNDTKAADTDALKKAAMKVGVGLYLSVRTGEGEAELPSYTSQPATMPRNTTFPTNNSNGTFTIGVIQAKSANGVNVNGQWYNTGKFTPENVIQTFASLSKGQNIKIIHGEGKTFINDLEFVGAVGTPTPTTTEEELDF